MSANAHLTTVHGNPQAECMPARVEGNRVFALDILAFIFRSSFPCLVNVLPRDSQPRLPVSWGGCPSACILSRQVELEPQVPWSGKPLGQHRSSARRHAGL